MPDDVVQDTATTSWAVPGLVHLAQQQGDTADVRRLGESLDDVLAVVPSALPPQAALARAEALLAARERLTAAALRAVRDVDQRELWRTRATGSTRTWLRTLPCGDRGQVALSAVLEARPVLDAALAAGEVSERTAAVVGRELARVPASVEPEQLHGVLVDGVGDLLGVWAGAACLDPTPQQEAEFDARRRSVADAVRTGLADCWSDAAGQLEPAFVLAATVLAPAEVEAGLRLLVDALQPEADAEALSEQEFRSRGLVLRRLRTGGWSLRAHLTDEVGQTLFAELAVREDTHPLQKARATRAGSGTTVDETPVDVSAAGADAADAGGVLQHDVDQRTATDEADSGADPDLDGPLADAAERDSDTGSRRTDVDADVDADHDTARYGAAGPGSSLPAFGEGTDTAVEGTPIASKDQRAHDALARLLQDLQSVSPGSGSPAPAHLTLVSSVDALEGRPGAPPGRLVTATGDVVLTPARLRRNACGAVLSAVLTDARGRPVGASGDHRHATRRERRAMRTAWGSGCGVNGCTLPGEVPHHAEPFWKSGETALKDLVPLCAHHHHDVHDGRKTLRLRDGRRLDEWGWAGAACTA